MSPENSVPSPRATKPPLLVHLLFHPESRLALKLALDIHESLNTDPIVPSLRVPTSFAAVNDNNTPAGSLDLDQAERSFVVVLADQDLNLDEDWCCFVADVWELCRGSHHRFLPIQLSARAYPLDSRLDGTNFARAHAETEDTRTAWVVRRLFTELCRYLKGEGLGTEAPIQLFLSHTKMDLDKEPKVVESLKELLSIDQPIKTWFDAADIETGSLFAEKIEEGVENASLLCVLTDHYASREWCRREVLMAKQKQRPIVVIDALTHYEVRSFPYLGNLPVLRWNDQPNDAIDIVLKETLRHLHSELALEAWREDGDQISIRPPELLTLTHFTEGSTVLYPDPPLGQEERQALQRLGIKCVTPLERADSVRS